MKVTGATAILKAIEAEGTEVIFGYPGGAIMPTYDSLYEFKKLRHVLVRHEQGAAHAAQGYSWATGKPGVCIATSGPGATNLVTGIADAMVDSLPMVFITGQVAKPLLGTDAFQETDVMGITMPITKWNYQIIVPEEIPKIMAKAFYIACSGRPGPVVIDVTKDAQIGELEWKYEKVTAIKSYKPLSDFSVKSIEEAVKLISAAKKPLIFAGHGVRLSNAEEALEKFAEKTGIPVACTLHGISVLPSIHPLHVGMLGMHGNYAPNVLTNEADLIIAVGMRFDDRVTGNLNDYAVHAKIVHIDIDPAEIGKILVPDVAIVADAKKALEELMEKVEESKHPEWEEKFAALGKVEFESVIDSSVNPSEGLLKMSEVVRRLDESSNGEAIVVSDVGQHQMMAARYYRFAKRDSWITSGGLGTMGFALPAGIGAIIGCPDRPVIVIVGDGGFQMTLQELATIAQEEIPLKIVILNNSYLGMVRQWQELFFDNRYSFVNLKNPDFVAVSKGFGIPASRVEKREDLQNSIEKLLSFQGPYLLDVVVEQEQNVFPMVPSGESVTNVRLE